MEGDVGPSEILISEDAQEEVSYFYSSAFFVAMTHISYLRWAFSAQERPNKGPGLENTGIGAECVR